MVGEPASAGYLIEAQAIPGVKKAANYPLNFVIVARIRFYICDQISQKHTTNVNKP
jgi:hypothetical protein